MDDLISRTIVLSAIDFERKALIEQGRLGAEHIVVHHARRLIEDLPAVDAVPVVHARWIPHKTPSGRETIFERCSACKQPTLVTRETPYCPWCGAKMDGERRDGDSNG